MLCLVIHIALYVALVFFVDPPPLPHAFVPLPARHRGDMEHGEAIHCYEVMHCYSTDDGPRTIYECEPAELEIVIATARALGSMAAAGDLEP